nr:hypothetical protein [Thioalkalivibrio nitratireducens]
MPATHCRAEKRSVIRHAAHDLGTARSGTPRRPAADDGLRPFPPYVGCRRHHSRYLTSGCSRSFG